MTSALSEQPEWAYFAEALGWYPTGYALTGAQTFSVVKSIREALRDGRLTIEDFIEPGYSLVLTSDVTGVVDEIERLITKLASGVPMVKGIASNSYAEGKGYAR